MHLTRTTILTLALGLTVPAGCQKVSEDTPPKARGEQAPASTARASKPPSTPEGKQPVKKPAADGKVTRIVFLDKKKACACTRKRIDASWKALNDVLGFPPDIDIERIHMDQSPNEAAAYKAKRPVMVPPAIYFFGKGNRLLEVLQGEVTVAQVRGVLIRTR